MTILPRGVRLIVGLAVCALTVSFCSFVASGTADAAGLGTCNNPRITDEFLIDYNYGSNGGHQVCGFPNDRPGWMDSLRTFVVKGAQHSLPLVSVEAQDYLPNGGLHVTATFHADHTVTTAVSGNGGPHGWVSATKVDCSQPFTPTAIDGNEGRELADFFYHVGQVVKTNTAGYGGKAIAATELVAPGGHVSYYAPHCTNLR